MAPELANGDGALGFWKAVEKIYPRTQHQRCGVHKTANVLRKVPKSVQAAMKDNLREVHGFTSPYAGPHLMVLALDGALPATEGTVAYHPAFNRLD